MTMSKEATWIMREDVTGAKNWRNLTRKESPPVPKVTVARKKRKEMQVLSEKRKKRKEMQVLSGKRKI
jgi:hypothetical protein